MTARRILAVCLIVVVAAACGSPGGAPDADGTWVGTITTEGNVTTVVNESGSVWGGPARLVEEASIGVETGADEYMLGAVYAVYGTEDHVYLIDGQLNVVRRYDDNGVFVDQVGRIGQGPGEYTEPRVIEVAPDGRIFAWDSGQRRIDVFAADGTSLDTWATNGAFCCVYPIFFDPDAGEDGDALWLLTYSFDRETRAESFAMQAWGPEGPVGSGFPLPDMGTAQEHMAEAGGRRFVMPFAPIYFGEVVGPARYAAASFDTYRYEVQDRGETTLAVEKHWDPVPVGAEQAEWERRATIARQRSRYPDFTWDGTGMPDHYPPYVRLLGGESGEIWVLRNAPSERVEDCVENPLDAAAWDTAPATERACWRNVYVADVFDAGGRFLGEVAIPPGAFTDLYGFTAHIDGDRIVMAVEDEAGVVRVKRYRLVLPGEAEAR